MTKHSGPNFDDLSEEERSYSEGIEMARQRVLTESESEMPAYEPDDGPLSSEYVQWLEKKAAASMPKGKVLSHKTLF